MTIKDWCRGIVEGPGGLRNYFKREAKRIPTQLDVVEWTIRCLANPHNEGSQEVLDAIIERRKNAKP